MPGHRLWRETGRAMNKRANYEQLEQEKRAKRDSQRKTMIGSGDRSQKIRTYNFPQNRLTDHRLGKSFHNLEQVIEEGKWDKILSISN